MPAPAGQPQPEKPASQELTDKEKKALLVYAAEVEAQDIQKRAGENPDGTPKMGAEEAKKQADAKLEALQKADPQFVDKLMAYEKYPGGNPKWAQINDQVAVIREEKALEAQIERDKKALDAKVKYEDKVRDWAAADRKGKDEANKDQKILALEAQLKEIDDARNADDAAKKAEKSTGETEKLLKGDTYNKDYDKEKILATDAHGKATETAGLTETAREKRQALQQQIDELKKAHSKDADAKWKELHDLENANPDAAKDPGSYELKKKLEDLKAREVSEKPRFNDGILDVIGQQDELQKNKAAEKDGEKDKADAKDNKEPPHLKEARDAVPPDGHGIKGGDHVADHELPTGAPPPPGKKPPEKSGLTPP
ncbi:MAG: hypothetical protein JO089_04765 [Alphaproteobacteria bacterium]|nr:hypothetical protein [Alphaproteobacteria bacterium]